MVVRGELSGRGHRSKMGIMTVLLLLWLSVASTCSSGTSIHSIVTLVLLEA